MVTTSSAGTFGEGRFIHGSETRSTCFLEAAAGPPCSARTGRREPMPPADPRVGQAFFIVFVSSSGSQDEPAFGQVRSPFLAGVSPTPAPQFPGLPCVFGVKRLASCVCSQRLRGGSRVLRLQGVRAAEGSDFQCARCHQFLFFRLRVKKLSRVLKS